MQNQAQRFTELIDAGCVAGREVADVPACSEDQVERQDPPGDPLMGRQRGGEQCEHDGPREAGVREVEDVVVDEFPRDP